MPYFCRVRRLRHFSIATLTDKNAAVFKPLHPAVNPLLSVFGATVIDDPRTVNANTPNEISLNQSGMDAKVERDLGPMLLASITAMHRTDCNIRQADLDGKATLTILMQE